MTATTPEGLGDALIPVVNKLQDIFSQVSILLSCVLEVRLHN